MGSKVHGVREGAGGYKPPEGASGEGEDSTQPIDSTRYFETVQGIKSYSEIYEIIAVAADKGDFSALNEIWLSRLSKAV